MKTNFRRMVLVFLHSTFFILPFAAPAATNDLSGALQKGLFEEEANRNLDAAITAYQSLVGAFDKDRKIAATAVFRLGEVYRKQGKTNEAASQYERIVQEFSDQTTLVTLSRQNLTGLGRAAQAPMSASVSGGATLDNLQSQYALLKAQLEQARRETNFLTIAKLLDDEDLRETLRNARTTIRLPGEQQKLFEAAAARALDYAEKRLSILQSAIAQARAGQSLATADKETSLTTDDEETEIRRIQAMIRNSPDLINAPQGGRAPLVDAATVDWLRVAAFLLDHRADVNLKVNGQSPLCVATIGGHKAMVELLLSRGADANAKDGAGRTPLHAAAQSGFVSVVETLLQHKADVNARDSEKNGQQTPLHLAAANGHPAIVKLLVANSADVNSKSLPGDTPLLYAAASGHRDTAAALLDLKADVNAANNDGRTPLHAAAEAGHLEVVTLLLERNASVNVQNDQGATPLLLAVFNQRTAVVKTLLEHKADPDLGSAPKKRRGVSWEEGNSVATPVYYSIKGRNNTDILALLLEHGADPNGTQTAGWRSLFQAIQDGNVRAVELLLAHKADPNRPDGEGNAPLCKGIGNPEIVRLLLEAGADANARDKDGRPALLQALNSGSPAILKSLLEHKADVNAAGPGGWTALHSAVGNGMREMVELLLAHKADVNARMDDGETPLDVAKASEASRRASQLSQMPPPPGTPASQRSSPSSEQDATKETPSLADLLRQHGALDDLPDFTTIRVTRQGLERPIIVFRAHTNGWNRFTLLETVTGFYAMSGLRIQNAYGYAASALAPFPDLSRIIIHRPARAAGGKAQEIKINLLNATNGVDCAKDMPLEFGDVVEIPARDYALNEAQVGLTREQQDAISRCLQRFVRLVVRGQTREVVVLPRSSEDAWLVVLLQRPEAKSLLLSSSDLSRVKVTRKNPATGKATEFVVNTSAGGPDGALWLQDGDVIEVPEK